MGWMRATWSMTVCRGAVVCWVTPVMVSIHTSESRDESGCKEAVVGGRGDGRVGGGEGAGRVGRRG